MTTEKDWMYWNMDNYPYNIINVEDKKVISKRIYYFMFCLSALAVLMIIVGIASATNPEFQEKLPEYLQIRFEVPVKIEPQVSNETLDAWVNYGMNKYKEVINETNG